MDPQQRLFLEVCWEALENAGQRADRLAGTQTGVFMGICTSDYSQLLHDNGDRTRDRRLLRHRQRLQRGLRPRLVRAGPARAELAGRYGLLVVAGGRAPGHAEPASRRVPHWRWPAA